MFSPWRGGGQGRGRHETFEGWLVVEVSMGRVGGGGVTPHPTLSGFPVAPEVEQSPRFLFGDHKHLTKVLDFRCAVKIFKIHR